MLMPIRNGLWSALTHVAGYIAGVTGSILIVRSLTPEAYGEFSYLVWLAGFISTLVTMAFSNSLTKIMAELRGQEEQQEAHALARWVAWGMGGANLCLSLGLVIWALKAPSSQGIYLLIIAAILVPNGLAAILRSTLWGNERYKPVTMIGTAASLLQLALIVAAFLAGWGMLGFVMAVLSYGVIQAMGLAVVSRRRGSETLNLRWPSSKTTRLYLTFLAPAIVAMLPSIVVWERSEVFFLARFAELPQVGFYSLAYTVYTMFLAVGWALVNGFLPAISREYGAQNWLRIQENVRKGLVMVTLYAVPLAFGGLTTLERLILTLYGPGMLPAVPVAQILFASLLPGVMAGLLGLTLGAAGGIWVSVRLGLLVSVVNIGLDLVLIPPYGAFGGALANASSQLIYTVLLLFAVYRLYGVEFPLRTVGSIVAVGAITTLLLPEIVEPLLPGIWGLFGTIILAGCLYGVIIWRLGYLRHLRTAEAFA